MCFFFSFRERDCVGCGGAQRHGDATTWRARSETERRADRSLTTIGGMTPSTVRHRSLFFLWFHPHRHTTPSSSFGCPPSVLAEGRHHTLSRDSELGRLVSPAGNADAMPSTRPCVASTTPTPTPPSIKQQTQTRRKTECRATVCGQQSMLRRPPPPPLPGRWPPPRQTQTKKATPERWGNQQTVRHTRGSGRLVFSDRVRQRPPVCCKCSRKKMMATTKPISMLTPKTKRL